MELKLRTVALAMALLLVMATFTMEMGSVAAAAPGGQSSLCKMSQEGLTACKPCISSMKAEEKPTDACCSALKQADLPCLCSYKNSMLLPYLGIDPKLAMQLPAKCSITPPDQC